MYPLRDDAAYARWVADWDCLDEDDRAQIRHAAATMPRQPLFSLVVAPGWLLDGIAPLVASLQAQLYGRWELLVEEGFEPGLPGGADSRIRAYPNAPAGLGGGLNSALDAIDGDYMIVVPEDAILAEQALFELAAAAVENPAAELIYTDEDRIDASGRRFAPWFKTGWDPELILALDSIGHLAAYSARALRRLGGFPRGGDSLALALYDLALKVVPTADAGRVVHVPAVACHRARGAAWDAEAARALVRDRFGTGETPVEVSPAPLVPQWSRVARPLPEPQPLVSVIVPTRDGAELLARCVDGLLSWTDYRAIEVLIVDNGSVEPETHALFRRLEQDPRVRILPRPGPFNFSALNNSAAKEARGEILLLLNNDTDVIGPEWLSEMVSHAVRPDVGAVGAKLIYGDGRLQHAGVVLGPGTDLIHQMRLSNRDDPGLHGELALTRTVAAVTGACVAVRKEVFFEVGGLDEEHLSIAFNDIDLCLKLGARGYRVVWTPFATLFHLESVSRGHEDTPEKHARMMRELTWLTGRWGPEIGDDRFHNANLVLGWDASRLAGPPRREKPWKRPLRPVSAWAS